MWKGPDGTMELREVANLVSSNGSPSSILGPGVLSFFETSSEEKENS